MKTKRASGFGLILVLMILPFSVDADAAVTPASDGQHRARADTLGEGIRAMEASLKDLERDGAVSDRQYAIWTRQALWERVWTDDDAGRSAHLALCASPNPIVRAVATSMTRLVKARRSPVDLRFTSLEGEVVDLREMRGKVILLEFGGVTHCAPCLAAEPFLIALKEKYQKQGFGVVSIAWDEVTGGGKLNGKILSAEEQRARALSQIKQRRLNWPHYGDPAGNTPLIHPDSYIDSFGVTRFPTFLLIDQNGHIADWIRLPAGIEPVLRKRLGLE